jgi:hypothetical protein
MSNTKHTPGPWVIGRNSSQIESGNEHWTVGLSQHERMLDGTLLGPSGCRGDEYLSIDVYSKSAEADVRLIAAAPELLEAVQAFQEWLHAETTDFATVSFDKRMEMCAVAQMKADAAIAKATQP